MKKLVLILSMVLFTTSIFAIEPEKGNPNEEVIKKSADGVTISVVQQVNEQQDQDALYCSIHCENGDEHSCWFCDCSSLPDCSGGRQK